MAPQSRAWPRAVAPPPSLARLPMIRRRRLHPSFTVEQFFRFSSLKFSPNKSAGTMLPTMILTIPMMKLSLQELYFIGRRLVCGYYLQRQRCSWTLPMGILTLGYRPHHWRPRRGKSWALLDGSRVEGAESAVHVVLSNSTANVLLSIQICFSPISERSCNISKVLGIFIVKFNTLLYSGFGVQCDYAHLEHWLHRPRPHRRRWLEALGYNIVFFYFRLFYM